MEYLFVKRCSERDPQSRHILWSHLMQTFLWEKTQWCREAGELLPAYLESADLSRYDVEVPIKLRVKLRDKTIEGTMSDAQVKKMLQKHDFFASDWHQNGKGLAHEYRTYRKKGEQVVIDFKTNLMWQQAGSKEMEYKDAKKYIAQLNRDEFAGYKDWRLPILEEAMSLMEPEQKKADLYIDPVFDKTQRRIWTADQSSASVAWVVYFNFGSCCINVLGFYDSSVRGVRSGQSSR